MGKLTATGVNKSKSESKVYRVSDGGGLFLEVRPNSSKYWRYNHRFFKKKRHSLLAYTLLFHSQGLVSCNLRQSSCLVKVLTQTLIKRH